MERTLTCGGPNGGTECAASASASRIRPEGICSPLPKNRVIFVGDVFAALAQSSAVQRFLAKMSRIHVVSFVFASIEKGIYRNKLQYCNFFFEYPHAILSLTAPVQFGKTIFMDAKLTSYYEQLENIAVETGWTLKDACIDAGLSDSTYYRWANGSFEPRRQPAERVAGLIDGDVRRPSLLSIEHEIFRDFIKDNGHHHMPIIAEVDPDAQTIEAIPRN